MNNGMETYHGLVRTPTDAIILFEACRIGLLPRVQRRLSEKERQSISSGSVFVWDEREAGMRRWTDGKSWSASRVSGSFLTYREMEGKRGGGSGYDKTLADRDPARQVDVETDSGPDGYRYKPDGLMKQSFSITTNQNQHLHLISYFSRSAANSGNLQQPSNDPQLRHIRPEKGMYPESTVNEQSSIPAVTRGPMSSPGYTNAPTEGPTYARAPGYAYGPPVYPPSPMHTPPPHSAFSPYYQTTPHSAYPGHSPLQHVQYPPQPPPGYGQQQMTAFDRPPPPLNNPGLPPPPGPHQYGAPVPPPPSGYQGAYQQNYQGGYPPYQYPAYQPPPLQAPNYPPGPQQAQYDTRTPQSANPDQSVKDESRQDSQQTHSTNGAHDQQAQAGAQAQAPPSSTQGPNQTIPSISAMLNGSEQSQQVPQPSPDGTSPRPLQDIPSHKLGFEANRDVQALRNLDKSTFKY